MRLARYARGREARLAAIDGDDLVDLLDALGGGRGLSVADKTRLTDMTAFVAGGRASLALAKRAVAASRTRGKGRRPLGRVRLLAPLKPAIIICSGENYWDHREEKPVVSAKEPEFFIKIPITGVIGPGDAILLDAKVTKKLDYETELAIVIGKPGRHIAKDKALEHIFGYTIMNDATARDRQVKLRPDGTAAYSLGPGKNFDTCAPLGPVIVTRDEITDPQALPLRTRVNGELRQNNSTAKMIWGVAELVHYFSTFLTLQPGWVISTGTPGGTAWGTDKELGGRFAGRTDVTAAPGYLKPGDVVECEIEGLGTLRNVVKAAPAA
jgi:2-keto-4-pentenoate hydratase/2-oxohepta-3-ene-1,7-dioic acid hydratase in catechol pathway